MNSSKKWIALSVLILFLLSGGVYQVVKNRKASQLSQENGSSTSGQSKVAGQPSNTSPSGLSNNNPGSVVGMVPSTGTQIGSSENSKGSLPSNPGPSKSGATQLGTQANGNGTPATGTVAPSVTGAGVPSVPGLPGGKLPATGNAAVAQGEAPKPQVSCFALTYKHKYIASHSDEETCSQHKNLIKLKHQDINPKSICVRVNGTPVHYLTVKGHPDELVIGSVAGPKSKVSVKYCAGKGADCALLKEDCTVPKDEFLEAIGGAAGAKGDPRLGQWDPTQHSEREADVLAKLDGDVRKELETNDDLNGRAPAGEMFKDWISDSEASACGTQQASN